MCGIAGAWAPGYGVPPLAEAVRRMVGALWRRGPDDDGHWVGEGVSLGMRRLSIIDVSGGHQPISSEDGNVVIVCNGEIYNYRELRSQLERRGHRFATGSDVEVAVHLYEESGTGMLRQLRGMFALAIWDLRQRQLLVARDRLGIKPLYFASGPAAFAFASELKAIRTSPWCPDDIDMEALERYPDLRLRTVPLDHL